MCFIELSNTWIIKPDLQIDTLSALWQWRAPCCQQEVARDGLQVPHGSLFFLFLLASCFSIFLPPPHVSPGANKTWGLWVVSEHMEQIDGGMKGGGRRGEGGGGLSWKCLSLSQQLEECDGRMDNRYVRLPARKLNPIWYVLLNDSHAIFGLTITVFFFFMDCVCVHRNVPIVLSPKCCSLCTDAQARTQTQANSQSGNVDRVSELWLQAHCMCVCVCVLFLAIR